MAEQMNENMDCQDLLIEIGTEELPPGALNQLSKALLKGVLQGLDQAQIPHDAAAARWYASPRRLACLIPQVAARQPDRDMERRGPAVAQAFDDNGEPKPAALGFARSVGVSIDEVQRLKTDKGEWLYHRFTQPGQALAELLPEILQKAVDGLPVPKPMRWGDYDTRFVRPVHGLVVLHGNDVLPVSVLDKTAGRTTRGHRIHASGEHEIANPADYLSVLEKAYVLADAEQRREQVVSQSQKAAAEAGLTARLEPGLVEEVTALVEWPVAVLCSFDEDFLQVPAEALISSMEHHQKFFPLLNADGSLSNRFIAFANIESKAPERVRDGFERVVRPRLADAKFFWDQDLKRGLGDYQKMLENVVFQNKLGSLADKTRRVAALAGRIAAQLQLDASAPVRAAELARCDLMSEMVGEFPELQGIMGRYYAAVGGEPEAVAQAIDEHYNPRQSGDPIAAGDAGRILAVAEKTDTLVGIFAASLKPTGAKDPFALRRAALGLVRTLIEGELELEISWLLQQAAEVLSEQLPVDEKLQGEVRSFILDRLTGYLKDQGFSAGEIQAVTALSLDHLLDLHARVQAVKEFAALPQAESLSAANKRCANILRQAEVEIPTQVDSQVLEAAAEQSLNEAVMAAQAQVSALLEQRQYTEAMSQLAQLEAPVNQFFDDVMVMADDEAVRLNRLALVSALRRLFLSIADVSKLSG